MVLWSYVDHQLERVKIIVLSIFVWLFDIAKFFVCKMMLGCECWCWSKKETEFYYSEPELFSLPSPLPQWPPGRGFSSGRISLGEIEVSRITKFDKMWDCTLLRGKQNGVTFYRPVGIPDGFFCLGHYCQPNNRPLRGYVLVAHDTSAERKDNLTHSTGEAPALKKPIGYTLIWSEDSDSDAYGYIWRPNSPSGYKAMGFVVTDNPEEPDPEEIRCVREDLTETCETCGLLLEMDASENPFQLWKTRPCRRGMMGTGVSVGTFFCRANLSSEKDLSIACLKNNDSTLHAMPNLEQIHALVQHYGPTVYFHPDEVYLPSSVSWFFKNGALLYQKGKKGERIDCRGSNLPSGGTNDGEFWIDLPSDEEARDKLKKGNLESAELYAHVKPAVGGTFTDIAMWVFCPFNGPATLKIGFLTIPMKKIGEHVGDWEHFTLRINNFTGELWSVYFSEHSGGKWVDAYDLEFKEGNKPIVYSSKHGHASFAHPGTYLQGATKLKIGARNDCARSKFSVDSSSKYQIIAAEYLGHGVVQEPCWLQYMREWGPTIEYDSSSELDKIINLLPKFVQFSVENFFDLFPTELYGEEGPTGPKQKNNWFGDERW